MTQYLTKLNIVNQVTEKEGERVLQNRFDEKSGFAESLENLRLTVDTVDMSYKDTTRHDDFLRKDWYLIVVKIFKDWYLTVDKGGHYYNVIKAMSYNEEGIPARGRVVQDGFLTAAEAISYVFEAEVREKVKQPELLDLAEFKDIYAELAEEVTKATSPHVDPSLPKTWKYDPFAGVWKYDSHAGVETR